MKRAPVRGLSTRRSATQLGDDTILVAGCELRHRLLARARAAGDEGVGRPLRARQELRADLPPQLRQPRPASRLRARTRWRRWTRSGRDRRSGSTPTPARSPSTARRSRPNRFQGWCASFRMPAGSWSGRSGAPTPRDPALATANSPTGPCITCQSRRRKPTVACSASHACTTCHGRAGGARVAGCARVRGLVCLPRGRGAYPAVGVPTPRPCAYPGGCPGVPTPRPACLPRGRRAYPAAGVPTPRPACLPRGHRAYPAPPWRRKKSPTTRACSAELSKIVEWLEPLITQVSPLGRLSAIHCWPAPFGP